MFDQAVARYEWGQVVVATLDLFNDGSFPDAEQGALLVAQGQRGEIVRVGHHVPTNEPVYLVDFGCGRLVGCLEEEIVLASLVSDAPLRPGEGK